jgi:polysaccharide deacetylase 2 family uncharacterized protein YibQ
MARGFLGGALLGGVLSTGVAVVASLIAPSPQPPISPQISDTAPGVAVAPQAIAPQAPEPQSLTDDATVSPDRRVPQTVVPDPDTLTSLTEETVAPSTAPQTGPASDLIAPSEAPVAGSVSLDREQPVLPNPQALAPMEPQPADEVSITTSPTARPQAEPEIAERAAEAVPPKLPSDQTDTPPAARAEPEAPVVAQTPTETIEVAPATPEPIVPQDQTENPQTAEEQPEDSSMEQAQAGDAPLAPPVSAAPAEPETSSPPQVGPQDEDTPQVAMIAPSSRPQIGTPAISLTERNTGVTVNRLGTGVTEPGTQPVTVSPDAGMADPGRDTRPIAQFAQPFDNPEDKPLMSIVLIDDGTSPTSGAAGIAALRSFPYALSFAVDSSLPDAAARMALYREEGFEVLAMVDLPEGAQPRDVETTLDATLAQLPEVMGVLEGPGAGLQGSRVVADQVTAFLSQSGHGLVTQDKGLNTMPKLARKEGVPAMPIFRDFDSKGQTATVIRRFLDQAAFKAGQEGTVIMLGRLRPDTISALLLWGLQDRAGQVALAPISAVLMREDAG